MLRRLFSRLRSTPSDRAWRAAFDADLARISPAAAHRGFDILTYPIREDSGHPAGYIDFECRFAAWHLKRVRPRTVLDIGSYRYFILGLSAFTDLISLDIRTRPDELATERLLTGDARRLDLPDDAFDVVVTLSSLEHFGLGRYGDDIDLDADTQAFQEMRRVLRPGGVLIFTTSITTGPPVLAFNAHRIYSLAQLHRMTAGMVPQDERFFSHARGGACPPEAITAAHGAWDVYCGCWSNPMT